MDLKSVKHDRSINNEELFAKARQGCEDSKDLLFKNNAPLIKKLAKEWIKRGSTEEFDELFSMGLIGLTIAYNTFDPVRNIKFTTYAGKLAWHEFVRMARAKGMVCRSKYYTLSIDEDLPDEPDASSWHEVLSDPEATDEYIEVENEIYNWRFELVIKNSKLFNTKERKVVRDYFFRNKSLIDIGKSMRVTRQASQQMYKRCLKKITDDGRMIV